MLRRLGFDPEWQKLNAADYGDATTRQRFILMARSDGRRVCWPVKTHARTPADHPGLERWRPARDIIDWNIKGRSIFDRKKALAAKTLSRIYAGAEKHGWPKPYLVVLRNHMAAQGIDLPIPTIAANGQHIGLATPIILSQHNSGAPRSVSDSLPTITTGGAGAAQRVGCARPMLVEPFIATVAHGNSLGDLTADSRRCKTLDEPLGTMHAGGGKFAIVEPFVLSQASGGVPRAVADPIPSQATAGAVALISPYYGSGSGETCNSVTEPLPTLTGTARFGMIVPVTNGNGGPTARSVAEPVPTITTAKGGEFAMVIPVTHAGGENRSLNPDVDPLPTVTGANRGELAFITAQHGEAPGQTPRVHGLADPAPTITATGHNLVEPAEGFDILFRMLEPHELAAAMCFNDDEQAYEFAGTKTERIKQIGNAVSVAKMKACVKALMADAAHSRIEDGFDAGREAA